MTEALGNFLSSDAMNIALTGIGERFAPLRIVEPQAEHTMLHSMKKYGQLTPVVVCRIDPQKQELLDGFKRLRAARELRLPELSARTFDLSIRAGKAAMLQLNRVGRAISGMEEALVVHSLHHEDGLNQVEIAELLDRHKSWVCRRMSLIERLSEEAQESIKLGLLPASLGAELARLQRCNQNLFLASIREHKLTWRETRTVLNALENEPGSRQAAILRDPRGTVLSPGRAGCPDPADEQGLSLEVKKLQRRLYALDKSCMDLSLLLYRTDPIMFEEDEDRRFRAACGRVLPSLARVGEQLRGFATYGKMESP